MHIYLTKINMLARLSHHKIVEQFNVVMQINIIFKMFASIKIVIYKFLYISMFSGTHACSCGIYATARQMNK